MMAFEASFFISLTYGSKCRQYSRGEPRIDKVIGNLTYITGASHYERAILPFLQSEQLLVELVVKCLRPFG